MDAFDLGFSQTRIEPIFTPYLVSNEHADLVFKDIPESVKTFIRPKLADGWRFYATKQTRGRCYYRSKVVTIPVWVIESKLPGKKIWYVSHEVAHTYTPGDQHDQLFMAKLREICPEQYQHYEIGYKPRNALAAGIRKPITLADL